MLKREVNVNSVLKDIRAGGDDTALMLKYRLTAKGLKSLLDKMVKAGHIEEWELEQRTAAIHEAVTVVADIADLTGEVKPVSPDQPPKISPKPIDEKTKRKISAPELVRDIEAGMADSEMMAKYNLSANGLEKLFDKLVASGRIARAEIDDRMFSFDSTIDLDTLFKEIKT